MACLPQMLDFQGFFLCFFSFLSFKTVSNIPKEAEEKVFEFSVLGGSKWRRSSLITRGVQHGSPRKPCPEAWSAGQKHMLRTRSTFYFDLKRRRFITLAGVVGIAIPTPAASKISDEEWNTGEEPQTCSSSALKSQSRATPDAVSGCMPDEDVHSVGGLKSL